MSPPCSSLVAKFIARCRRRVGALVVALMGCFIFVPAAFAQNINWAGGTSTDWNTAANWDSSTVPTSSNNITLDTNSGNQAVISTGTLSGNNIIVGNTTASGANTTLIIQSGTHLTASTFLVGNATGSTGSVLVTDVGTVLSTPTSTNPLNLKAQVGVNGTASLTIANGALVTGISMIGDAAGSSGTVLVTGDGSKWQPGTFALQAGGHGTSNITLADGGSITGNPEFVLGGNNSQFTVSGQAASGNHSTLNSNHKIVDEGNNSIMTISNGGQIIDIDGIWFSGNGTSTLVTDPGSEMVAMAIAGNIVGQNGLYVGLSGTDNVSLTVANGGNLTSATFNYIGYSGNSTGAVTITDPGSVWNATGNIVVGNATNSTGSLTLANGGSINITSGNIVLGQNGGTGILNLNNGAFFQNGNANGSLVSSSKSFINWGGGTMQVTKNLSFSANMTMTGNGCTFDTNGFNVTFNGALSGTGNLTKNGNGNLSIGTSNGVSLSYTGKTVINAGTLIATLTPGSNLSTNITDNANLTINLSITSANYTGVLSGNGNVTVQGRISMNGTSTFTGNIQTAVFDPIGLTFNGDTSQMGGNITNTGEMYFAQNFDTSYAGNLSGNGAIFKSGSGNLTLSGNIALSSIINNIFFGSFQVQSGNLTFTGNTPQFQGGVNISSGANVVFNQNTNTTLRVAGGSGNLTQAGAGTLTINDSDVFGAIVINSGTVQLVYMESGSTDNGVFTPTGNIVNNSALIFAPPYDDNYLGSISGNGAVTINATTANLALSGNCTYTGNTTINSGTLLVIGQLPAASSVTVNNGAMLSGNGSVPGPIFVAAGGNLAPGCTVIPAYTILDSDGSTSEVGAVGPLAPSSTGTGTLSVNTLTLDPNGTISFALTDPGNCSTLSLTGSLAETGNVVLNLNNPLQSGTYQLITSTGGLSGDFKNVTLAGVYSGAMSDSGGVWSASVTGADFTFNAATGQLMVTIHDVTLDPSSTTTLTITDLNHYTKLSTAGTLTEAGNLVLNLGGNLFDGTYQILTGGSGVLSNFSNVTLTGLLSTALTNNNGVWSGTISGVNFTLNAATGELDVTGPVPIGSFYGKGAWLENYFNISQLLDPGISGDNACPAGDGIPNLVKNAFFLNPWLDGHAGLPQPTVANGNLVLTFWHLNNTVVTLESSTDLINWSSTGQSCYALSFDPITLTYPIPSSGAIFLRLVVTEPVP